MYRKVISMYFLQCQPTTDCVRCALAATNEPNILPALYRQRELNSTSRSGDICTGMMG